MAMPMPSLFKYFLTVGAALIGVLFLANYLLEQPAPATAQNAAAAKSLVVKTDPQASRVERWRAEQAAAEAARKEDAAARLAAELAEPEPTAAQPAKAAATPAVSTESRTADASLTATAAPAAEQAKLKSRKARAAEKARTKRLARDDARTGNARDRVASNQQDDYYYGQRQNYPQQGYPQQGFGQRPAYAPSYAYAPQQSYGPFNGGWGRGW
jgi:hypothetical protein